MVTCAVCESSFDRTHRSVLGEVPFVCANCRCSDCYIVLSRQPCPATGCSAYHGRPSKHESGVCVVCMNIRERVGRLDPETRAQRLSDAVMEQV